MEDSVTVDEIIIMMVMDNPHSYRKDNAGYKDAMKIENTWLKIAEGVDQTAEYTRKRWENLRDRFVRTYRKANEQAPSGSGKSQKETVSFPYYQEMMFLAPHLRKKRTVESHKEMVLNPQHGNKKIKADLSQDTGVSPWNTMDFLMSDTELPIIVEEPVEFGLSDDDVEPRPSTSSQVMSPQKRARSLNKTIDFKTPEVDNFCTRKRAKTDTLSETLSTVVSAFNKLAERQQQPKQPVTQECNSGDTAFMKSVVEDMQCLSRLNKMKFKRIVLQTLETLVGEEI